MSQESRVTQMGYAHPLLPCFAAGQRTCVAQTSCAHRTFSERGRESRVTHSRGAPLTFTFHEGGQALDVTHHRPAPLTFHCGPCFVRRPIARCPQPFTRGAKCRAPPNR
jgi:hypothetical protein